MGLKIGELLPHGPTGVSMGALKRVLGGSVGALGAQFRRFGEDLAIDLERILGLGCDEFCRFWAL